MHSETNISLMFSKNYLVYRNLSNNSVNDYSYDIILLNDAIVIKLPYQPVKKKEKCIMSSTRNIL